MPLARTTNLARLARLFHALADETRLRILQRLGQGEECVCELTDLLQTGQSRLSFHLKTMKEAGLLTDRRDGRWIYYSLNEEALEELEEVLGMTKATSRQHRDYSKKNCE